MLCLVCIPCIKGQTNHAGRMPIHCHLPMLYTVGGTPDTAAGSTSSSAGATVPPMQSSAQQSTPLTSGQPPSMHQAPPSQLGQQQSTHQAPLSHQGQQPQMPITSQFQQPIGILSNIKSTIPPSTVGIFRIPLIQIHIQGTWPGDQHSWQPI